MFFIRVEQKSVQLWLTDYLHYTGGGELADTVSYFNNRVTLHIVHRTRQSWLPGCHQQPF